jgi:hypothetical protein
MRAADLTSKQRHRLLLTTAARRDYFARLRRRMDNIGWDHADDTYRLTVAAYEAAQAVVAAVHTSRPVEPPMATNPVADRIAHAVRSALADRRPGATVAVVPLDLRWHRLTLTPPPDTLEDDWHAALDDVDELWTASEDYETRDGGMGEALATTYEVRHVAGRPYG